MSIIADDQNSNSVAARVIEALRSGVPAGSAVKALGSNQPHIVDAFQERLARSLGNERSNGFLVEGGFGCGKSHLLANLREVALDSNFACSIVCVSKEMTLATITHVFLNAIRELRLPGKSVGGSCAEFVDRFRFNSREFARLLAHYSDDEDKIGSLFGASLRIFESYQGQSDVLDLIIDFWDGERSPVAEMKRDLRAIGMPWQHLRSPMESSLGLHRLQFVSNMLVGAGYAGWVILIDEGEMIAKLSMTARAKSYANLASLLGSPALANVGGLLTVVAITDDLWHHLLTERDDRHMIDNRLRLSKPQLAEVALEALDYLQDPDRTFALTPITPEKLASLRSRVTEVYSEVYPDAIIPTFDSLLTVADSRNVRSHLKEWITDWDLRRLYRGYEPHLSEREVSLDLSENIEYIESEDVQTQ